MIGEGVREGGGRGGRLRTEMNILLVLLPRKTRGWCFMAYLSTQLGIETVCFFLISGIEP